MSQLILFDLDGTLIDSLDDIHTALTKAQATFAIPPLHREVVKKYVGPGIDELLMRATEDSGVPLEAFRNTYRDIYLDTHMHTALYKGVPELLQTIKSKDVSLCILTNKPEQAAKRLLQTFEISHFFDHIIGPDTYGFCKPHPGSILELFKLYPEKPKKIFMVGDGDADILVAKAASIQSIGVTYGYRTREKLAGYQPSYLVDTVSELEILLKKLTSY